jgi:hypothetical protein
VDAPDLPHAVAGWRTWTVSTGPGGTRLLAPVSRAGWRGEHGYPVILFAEPALPERTCTRLITRYGVPVHRLPAPLETLVRGDREAVSALAARVRDETARAPGSVAPHREQAVADLLAHVHGRESRSA